MLFASFVWHTFASEKTPDMLCLIKFKDNIVLTTINYRCTDDPVAARHPNRLRAKYSSKHLIHTNFSKLSKPYPNEALKNKRGP